MLSKIITIGNSKGITISKNMEDIFGLKVNKGDFIDIEIKKVIRKVNKPLQEMPTKTTRELYSGFLNCLIFNILDFDHLGVTSSKTTVTPI